ADHPVSDCRSRPCRMGGVAAPCARYASCKYVFIAASRVLDPTDRQRIEKGGGDPQRTCFRTLARAPPEAISEGRRISFRARGEIYFHVVTIPEGYTMFDIAKAMEDAGLGSAADFLQIAETQTQLISDL